MDQRPMEDREIKELSNNELYLKTIATLDPELYLIKSKLATTGVNPAIIPAIIEALDQVNRGSGWGKVEVEIRDHKAIKCRGIDDRLLELELTGIGV